MMMNSLFEQTSSIQILGHRGCAGLLPENSLSGCARAIDMGLNGFEIDVQLSADDEIIVYHNLSINQKYSRLNGLWQKGRGAALKSLTLTELRQYDIGRIRPWTLYRLKRRRQQGTDQESIPTLQQIFELVQQKASPEFQLWIEIKTSPLLPEFSANPDLLVEKVLKLIHDFDFQKRVVLLSFDWRGLHHLQITAPHIRSAFLTIENWHEDTIHRSKKIPSPWLAGYNLNDYQGSLPQMIKAAGGHYWAPHYKGIKLKDIQEAHRLGLQVYAVSYTHLTLPTT